MKTLQRKSIICLISILVSSSYISGQEIHADKAGVKISGQLVYKIENRTEAITIGHMFALSADKKQILGYSETSSGPTFDNNPYRQGGRWLIEGLPYNQNIILVGFAKNVKRLIWIESIKTTDKRFVDMGQNIANLTIPNSSPAESFIPLGQVIFLAGWVGEFYETKKQVEFVDALVANILEMHENTISSKINISLTKDLVSYWKIDETTGSTIYDAHGTNNCTVNSGVSINQNGLLGNSASFVSTSKGLSTGKKASDLGISGGTSKSVSIWIKPDISLDGRNSCGIISLGSRANQQQFGIKYYGVPAYWMFDSWYGAVRIGANDAKLADGLWHNIVVTYNSDGHLVKTYLDGNLVSEDGTKVLNIGDYYDFSIGIGSQGNYIGLIDEVGLWKRALNESEVKLLYNFGKGLKYPF